MNLQVIIVAFLTFAVSGKTTTAAFVPSIPQKLKSASFTTRTTLKMSTVEPASLDPGKTALVLIEFQNEFTTEGGKLHEAVKECQESTRTIANAQKTMNAAREAGVTIIHCPIMFEKGHQEISPNPYGILAGVKTGEAFIAGEWGSEFCQEMTPQPGDLVVKGKSGLCGFHSTNLDFLLRQNQIENVVLAGYLTNCCVESSMRTAYEHGYRVHTLKDCCAATSLAGQNAAFEHTFGMFSVPTSSDVFLSALKAPAMAT